MLPAKSPKPGVRIICYILILSLVVLLLLSLLLSLLSLLLFLLLLLSLLLVVVGVFVQPSPTKQEASKRVRLERALEALQAEAVPRQ